MITVRPATEADAEAMSAVLTASITELCVADHRNDPALVARWTANKTIEGVRVMLADPESRMYVAEHDGELAAVGSVTANCIGLNYVHPAHRFSGVSKALLAALEDDMRRRGMHEATLESTTTARRFYLEAGWIAADRPQDDQGMTCFPMRKPL